jgi:hypothetical protein
MPHHPDPPTDANGNYDPEFDPVVLRHRAYVRHSLRLVDALFREPYCPARDHAFVRLVDALVGIVESWGDLPPDIYHRFPEVLEALDPQSVYRKCKRISMSQYFTPLTKEEGN